MSDLNKEYEEDEDNWEEQAFLEGMEEAEFGGNSNEPFLGDLDEFEDLEKALEKEFAEK